LQVIKKLEFSEWNAWYQNNKISLNHFPSETFYPHQLVVLSDGTCTDHGIVKQNQIVRLQPNYSPCGISGKNPEQIHALQILKDSNLPLKILTGGAGTGKTLLACAHAVEKLGSSQHISKIVIAKSMTPVGKGIGFLKGDMKEKTLPWLGPFLDNLIHCGYEPSGVEDLIEDGKLEITPITFIQGRSISNAIIIIDEVQNLDISVIKQLITRAAENSEIILLGDQSQVFEHYLKDKTLDYVVQKALPSELVGISQLNHSVRSKIADWAVKNL